MLTLLPQRTACCFAGTDIGQTLPRDRLRRLTRTTNLRKRYRPSMPTTIQTTRRGDLPRSFVFIKNDDFVITSLLTGHSTLGLCWNVFKRHLRYRDQAYQRDAIGVDNVCLIRVDRRKRIYRRGNYLRGVHRTRAYLFRSVLCVLRKLTNLHFHAFDRRSNDYIGERLA